MSSGFYDFYKKISDGDPSLISGKKCFIKDNHSIHASLTAGDNISIADMQDLSRGMVHKWYKNAPEMSPAKNRDPVD